MEAHNVSNFEGARGYGVVFVCSSTRCGCPTRMVLFGFGFESSQVFDLKLRGVPRREDVNWTDWIRAKRDVKAV
jgi:hypothetical protein